MFILKNHNMKRKLQLMSLLIAIFAVFQTQTLVGQTGFALNLPGSPNGANSHMRLPALNSKITGFPFTIEMWVKPSGWVSYGGFFSDRPGTTAVGSNATTLQFDNNANSHYIRCDYNGNSRMIPATTLAGALCNNGVWNHLTYTVWADSAQIELNGVYYKVAYATKTWNSDFCNGVSTYIGWDNTTFAGQLARAVPGLFDEIRIWNTARTNQQIEENKNVVLNGDEAGLVAYYNFDDKTTNDKTLNGFHATASGATLTNPNTPVISISEKNIVLEVEKELQPYPLFIKSENLVNNIVVEATSGFFLEKTVFTPTDFASGGGTVAVFINATTANVGDTGKVVISYALGGQTYKLDSVRVTPVPTYDRYIITNKANKLVLGNHSSLAVPAMTELRTDDYTQYYLLRPVHPGVNDSLFYIMQDGEYRMLRKGSNDWDTEFGNSGNEAIWKIIPQSNGTSKIDNFVTVKSLGVTALEVDTRLLDNNNYKADPTSSPYCEWLVQTLNSIMDPTDSHLSGVTLSSGLLNTSFDPLVTSYNVLSPLDQQNITVSGTAKSIAAFVNNNDAVLNDGAPAEITCVSGDNSSSTKYTFNYEALAFSDWAARGETSAARSVPSQWGWKCANATWVGANSTAAGTVRYIDNPAKYYTLGDTLNVGVLADTVKYKGRIMYVRWDGSITTAGVYSYPIKLIADTKYVFKGKYAWNSVVPADVTTATITMGINTAGDNTGTSLIAGDFTVESTDLLHLHNASFEFTPTASGVYYFTVQSNTAILGALADLWIGSTTALSENNARTLFASVVDNKIQLHGANAGEIIKVYNTNGQLIRQLPAESGSTSIDLKSGVFLFRIGNDVLRVIK